MDTEAFSYAKSTFKVLEEKEGSARVSLWRTIKTPAVFTLETSVCGAGVRSKLPHFIIKNYL